MSEPSVRFTVVVPVYNNAEDLKNCLDSLSALNFPENDYEVIVVDNNSTDNSVAVALQAGVTVLRETQFQSSYAARNKGIEAARGAFIAFTDSDCVVHPDWLKEIDALTGDNGAGCFAGEILSTEPQTLVERFSDSIGLLRQKGPLSGWHFKPYAQTANAVYRKAVFDRIGLFEPTMKSGGDAAIAWRMLDETDYTIRFAPEAIVYHHHRTSVEGLYQQFRRYGGGKMSWATAQADYNPPKIEALERDASGLFAQHISALEASGADDAQLFSGLKAFTKMAELSGYLEDLLRYTSGSQDLGAVPGIARERAPRCNICGSTSFVPGPNGRLANGHPPQCHDCGSLERHRVLHSVLMNFDKAKAGKMSCLCVGEALRPKSRIFGKLSSIHRDEIGSISQDQKYDVVIATDYFQRMEDGRFDVSLAALVKPLHPESILISIQTPNARSGDQIEALMSKSLPNAFVFTQVLQDRPTHSNIHLAIASSQSSSIAAMALLKQS